MEFWKLLHPDTALAAVHPRSGEAWSYADLRRDAARLAEVLKSKSNKTLGVISAENSYLSIVAYLGALRSGSAAILVDASLAPSHRRELIRAYRPDWVFDTQEQPEGYRDRTGETGLWWADAAVESEIHPDLALLLATSGSTGSPKLVRLTLRNLAANASSIARYLGLSPQDRPITSLPMSYSYGLSVLNSHLGVGATLVLTDESVLQKGFWETLDGYQCTSMAGVPYTYQMLLGTGLLKTRGATLRTLTQAGGRLDEKYIRQMHELAGIRGWKFFVMYGQTEATARISFVPWEKLGEKIGSVGVAIPDGHLDVDSDTHELIYRGPNVMLGYAESREDLAKGDELSGVLRTGDTARCDEDGFYFITGRLKRFLKMFGKRLNLDDAERVVAKLTGAPVACYGRDDLLMAAVENGPDKVALESTICEAFNLPRVAVKVVSLPQLPRTPNGKLDYKLLATTADADSASGMRVTQA